MFAKCCKDNGNRQILLSWKVTYLYWPFYKVPLTAWGKHIILASGQNWKQDGKVSLFCGTLEDLLFSS